MPDAHEPAVNLRYRRVLLKLSGEALMGAQDYGIDSDLLGSISRHLKRVLDLGVEVALVVGGGNIFRGVAGIKHGIDRVTGDHMGMLATVINALALMSALEAEGVEVRVQTAIEMHEVAEPFILRRATQHLHRGRLVIFAAGTGHPFFSTDTAAALRAAQIGAEALLMAKNNVDGVYDDDPNTNPAARRYDELDYDRLMQLGVMDATAATLASSQGLPIHVFDFAAPDNIRRIVLGEKVGTIVHRTGGGSTHADEVARGLLGHVDRAMADLRQTPHGGVPVEADPALRELGEIRAALAEIADRAPADAMPPDQT